MQYNKLKPMLAAGKPKQWSEAQWLQQIEDHLPLIATPKIDGIRCVCMPDGFPLSRSLKDIPNGFIREYFHQNREFIKPCLDGELIVSGGFQACGIIMSHYGEPNFTYWIFDVPSDKPYKERVDEYSKMALPIRFKTVPTVWITTMADLSKFEGYCLAAGYEGVCIRTPDSPYKFGRSTQKQGWLLKLKRFETAECVVTGFEPLQHNTNAEQTSETGHTVRSTHKAGMVTSTTKLGKFIVRGINNGFEDIEFKLGSGLNSEQREAFWEGRTKLIGMVIEYKYQNFGIKDAPRTPIFLRFRDADTL